MKHKKRWKETSRIKQRQWRAHIQAWVKSGLTQNEYCRQHKLSSSQFCYWKKKLQQAEKSSVSFVPVPVCTSVAGSRGSKDPEIFGKTFQVVEKAILRPE